MQTATPAMTSRSAAGACQVFSAIIIISLVSRSPPLFNPLTTVGGRTTGEVIRSAMFNRAFAYRLRSDSMDSITRLSQAISSEIRSCERAHRMTGFHQSQLTANHSSQRTQ